MNFRIYMDLKIMFLGPANVGKTSIICRYCNDMFEPDPLSTIGAGFSTMNISVDNNNLTLYLWDTAGEERFRSIAPSLIHGAHGLVLVYDITNPNFDDSEIYWKMFIDNATTTITTTDSLPILLMGNKIDVIKEQAKQEANNIKRENEQDQNDSLDEEINRIYEEKVTQIKNTAIDWCKDHNIKQIEFVSAKTGENINDAMYNFAKKLMQPSHGKERVIPLGDGESQKKNCC